MTTDLFTAEEITTRKLFDALEKTQENILISTVFRAMYYAAMPADKIEKVAAAIHGFETLDLQAGLTALCRKKVLRSRVKQGKRLYEVNY